MLGMIGGFMAFIIVAVVILVILSSTVGRPNIVPTDHHFWPVTSYHGLHPWPVVFLLVL